MWVETVVMVILIALSGLFSGSEIALFSLSDIKVRKLVRQRRRGAKVLRELKEEPHKLLVTILIGTNLVNIAAAALATVIFTEMFGSQGLGIATGVMTFLVLVFGEITPKSFCHQNAERVSLVMAGPFYILTKILYPVVVFIEHLSLGMLRIFGKSKKKPKLTEEDLKTALSMGTELGVIEKDEEEMIHNIFEFGDTRTSEVMVPRGKIVAIRSDQKLSDVLTKILESRYSRIPVYKGSFDNMIGVIHIKSVLKHLKRKQFDTEIEKLVSPVMFVKGDKNLNLLMDDFRETGMHMAVVTDKKGYVKGLVTLEDLLEEIVGEIYDESDVKKTKLRLFDEKSIIVEAETPLKDITKVMGIEFKQKDLKTIADLIVNKLGRFPKKGDKIKLKNFRIIVKDADKERIKRIKIVKKRGKIKK
jgi:putative hemolysin